MKFEDIWPAFIIAALFFGGMYVGRFQVKDRLLRPCEATLPRDQHCVLTAVPEDRP